MDKIKAANPTMSDSEIRSKAKAQFQGSNEGSTRTAIDGHSFPATTTQSGQSSGTGSTSQNPDSTLGNTNNQSTSKGSGGGGANASAGGQSSTD